MITWNQVSVINSNSKCTLPLNLLLSMILFILLVYLSSYLVCIFECYCTYQFIRLKYNLCKEPYGLSYILFENKIVANALKMERN